jgi:hypothetical protein
MCVLHEDVSNTLSTVYSHTQHYIVNQLGDMFRIYTCYRQATSFKKHLFKNFWLQLGNELIVYKTRNKILIKMLVKSSRGF